MIFGEMGDFWRTPTLQIQALHRYRNKFVWKLWRKTSLWNKAAGEIQTA
jgi:hypothetical protein